MESYCYVPQDCQSHRGSIKWMDYTRLKKITADIAVETGGPEARGRNMVSNNDNDSTHGNASANVKNPVTPSKSFDSNRSITPMRIKEREVNVFFEELKKFELLSMTFSR